MGDTSRLGNRLGPRIAALIQKALQAHLLESGPHRAMLHAEGLNEFHRQIAAEHREFLSPLLQLYLDGVPDDHPLAAYLRFLVVQPGEGSTIASLLGAGQAIGTGLSTGIADLLAPVNQAILHGSPNMVLPPQTAAAAVVGGFVDDADAANEAAFSGLNAARFSQLVEISRSYLSGGQILDALNRGLITENLAADRLTKAGYLTPDIATITALARQLIAPADAALMELKGILTPAEAAAVAAASGIEAGDFANLVLATGEPPGLMQLLEAYRRGFIDEATLEHGIRESRVRDEWIPTIKDLRYEPMDTSDAVRAVVQGYLTAAQATAIADQNGLEPGAIDVLLEVEGNPISPGEAFELWNRGLIDQDQVEQALRESHLKDKYIVPALNLRVKYPEGRQVVTMVEHDALSLPEAQTILTDLGYTDTVAAALIKSGTSTKTAANKALAIGQVTALYEDRAISEADAAKMLAALGYGPTEVAWVLRLADLRVEHAYLQAAVGHVRAAVVARHITPTEASGQLDQLGTPADQRDQLINLWGLEVAATVRVLTPAQILKANKLNVFSDQEALDRLTAEGYSQRDAETLITIDGSGGVHGTAS